MHVLYDQQIFVEQNFGGISRYFAELMPRVARASRATLFLGMHCSALDIAAIRKDMTVVEGQHVDAGKLLKLGLGLVDTVALNAYAHWGDVSVYHPTYYGVGLVHPSVPRVVTVHDMIHEMFPEQFRPWNTTTVRKRLAVARADHVIAVSEQTKLDLMRFFGTPERKITVVHHGASRLAAAASPRSGPGERYLLYVGTRRGYKNFDRFLEAFAQLAGSMRCNLLCVGGGPFTEAERAASRNLRVEEFVTWRSLKDDELAAAYRGALAFVCPSLYEGFGLPVLEAMQLGCPVACSNAGSLPEVAGEAAVYFEPERVESIVKSLRRLLESVALRRELESLGLRRAEAFSWDVAAEKTMDVYRRISRR